MPDGVSSLGVGEPLVVLLHTEFGGYAQLELDVSELCFVLELGDSHVVGDASGDGARDGHESHGVCP